MGGRGRMPHLRRRGMLPHPHVSGPAAAHARLPTASPTFSATNNNRGCRGWPRIIGQAGLRFVRPRTRHLGSVVERLLSGRKSGGSWCTVFPDFV